MLAVIVLYTLHDTFDTLTLECQKCHEAGVDAVLGPGWEKTEKTDVMKTRSGR